MKKNILIAVLMIVSLAAFAQPALYDSLKRPQGIYSTGNMFKIVGAMDGGVVLLPRGIPVKPMAYSDSGAVAFRNGVPIFWTGLSWVPFGTGSGGSLDSLTVVENNHFRILPYNGDTTILVFSDTFQDTVTKVWNKIDSIVLRGSSLKYFTNGDSINIGTISGSASISLQNAFDNAPTADPQINAHGNSLNIDSLGISVFKGYGDFGNSFFLLEPSGEGIGLISNQNWGGQSYLAANSADNTVQLRVTGGGKENRILMDSARTRLYNLDSTLRVGINTLSPDSSFTVRGGVNFRGLYYNAGARYKMLVRDTVTGGVAYQNIPSGSVDSTNLLTKTATQTVTGSTTFNNTSVGSANLTVTAGVQDGSDYQGLVIGGTYSATTNAHPFRVNPVYAPSSNGLAIAAADIPVSTSGTANIDHIAGYQGVQTHGSSGTLATSYGAYVGLRNNGGTTTNRYGYYAVNATGTGAVTNQYMFYAEDPTKGATTNYAFFAAGAGKLALTSGIAEIGGQAIIGFGTGTAPGAQLEVRRNGAVGSRIRNNANWWQLSAFSGSTSLTLHDITGTYGSFHNGGGKTFYTTGGDSTNFGQFMINQAVGFAYRTSTSTSITLNTNDVTFNSDATAGNVTVNLPTAVGCKGRVYIVRKLDASGNTVTIDGNGSETINGTTTKVLSTQYSGYMLQSDNVNWMIISAF